MKNKQTQRISDYVNPSISEERLLFEGILCGSGKLTPENWKDDSDFLIF